MQQMDFFERQDRARRSSAFLVAMMILSTVLIALAVHLIASFGIMSSDEAGETTFSQAFMNLDVMPFTIGIPVAVIVVCMLYRVSKLAGGGPSVAVSVGGVEVPPNTRDFRQRRLLNIVQEMSIAAGIKMPRVFVLPKEDGINAFAAGYSPDDAAVAVTQGCLDSLNREELQGVIGHEFSHILNGDMRLNIWLIGVLGGIFGLSMLGYFVMRSAGALMRGSSRKNSKDNGAAVALAFFTIGIFVYILGTIGVFFGRIIQAAVSRKREHLADASAVQFTRNPQGLADALAIIGASAYGGRVSDAHASELSHMFFAGGVRELFATHPPLDSRIKLLNPNFNGDYTPAAATLKRRMKLLKEGVVEGRDDESDVHEAMLGGILAGQGLRAGMREAMKPGNAPSAGPQSAPVRDADGENPGLPRGVTGKISDQYGYAEVCVYAAVLSKSGDTRAKQLGIVAQHRGQRVREALEQRTGDIAEMNCAGKRAVCELALQSIAALPEGERAAISDCLDKLSRADGMMDSFEFALGRLVHRRLFSDKAKVKFASVAPKSLANEARCSLSALAWFGNRDKSQALRAYLNGVRQLGSLFGDISLGEIETPDIDRLEQSLMRLSRLAPLQKIAFLNACKTVASDDGAISEIEANIVAAYADAVQAIGWSVSD